MKYFLMYELYVLIVNFIVAFSGRKNLKFHEVVGGYVLCAINPLATFMFSLAAIGCILSPICISLENRWNKGVN